MSEAFIGEIRMFAGNFPPREWAFCDGQVLAIRNYEALYSIIGPTYGGDGRTTFALPDLRGRVPKHAGHGNGPGLSKVGWGQKGGREEHTLSEREMPSHSHTAKLHAETREADNKVPQGNLLAFSKVGSECYRVPDNAIPNRTMSSDSISVENSGGGNSFNIQGPYLGINFIIALQGIFPSRS